MTNKEQSNNKAERVILTTNPSITALDQHQWNMMVPEDDPSLQYEFLRALEDSGSCISETGWAPCHIAASIDGQLIITHLVHGSAIKVTVSSCSELG